MADFFEKELYEPVRGFFMEQGYTVKAEVKHCDVTAQKNETLVIVELKKSFQLKLVYQAIDRQSITDMVYVAIPRPKKGQNTKEFKNMKKLLKRLHIGLLTVALDSELKTVDVILEPLECPFIRRNKKRVAGFIQECQNRTQNYNTGGVCRKKIVTAYREKAIELACILKQKKEVSTQELRAMAIEQKQIAMLGSNFYKWFERVKKGVYTLSKKGIEEISQPDYKPLVQYYESKYELK